MLCIEECNGYCSEEIFNSNPRHCGRISYDPNETIYYTFNNSNADLSMLNGNNQRDIMWEADGVRQELILIFNNAILLPLKQTTLKLYIWNKQKLERILQRSTIDYYEMLIARRTNLWEGCLLFVTIFNLYRYYIMNNFGMQQRVH